MVILSCYIPCGTMMNDTHSVLMTIPLDMQSSKFPGSFDKSPYFWTQPPDSEVRSQISLVGATRTPL